MSSIKRAEGVNGGKTFVPIVELLQLIYPTILIKELEASENVYKIRFSHDHAESITGYLFYNCESECFGFVEKIKGGQSKHFLCRHQREMFDLMDSWHINYRNLPASMFIDATTVNCY